MITGNFSLVLKSDSLRRPPTRISPSWFRNGSKVSNGLFRGKGFLSSKHKYSFKNDFLLTVLKIHCSSHRQVSTDLKMEHRCQPLQSLLFRKVSAMCLKRVMALIKEIHDENFLNQSDPKVLYSSTRLHYVNCRCWLPCHNTGLWKERSGTTIQQILSFFSYRDVKVAATISCSVFD